MSKPTKQVTSLARELGIAPGSLAKFAAQGCPLDSAASVAAWLKQRKRPAPAPPDTSADLAARVRACGDPVEFANLAREILAQTVTGDIAPSRVTAINALLSKVQHALENLPTESVDKQLFCTEEAARLVKIFEAIVNGRRRAEVLRTAERELEADALDFPDPTNADAVRAKLAELGLDAFGEEQGT